MVSTSQHIAGSATDARQRPGAARFADGSGSPLLARCAARIAVGLVVWNTRKIHFSHRWKTAAARMAVKGAPFSGAFIEAKRRPLTAILAAKATRVSAPGRHSSTDLLYSTRLRAVTAGYSPGTANNPFFF